MGCLSLGKMTACGPVACPRGSHAANSGCGWKIIWSSAGWHLTLCEVSHLWRCISHPAVLSSGGAAGMSTCTTQALLYSSPPFVFVVIWESFLFSWWIGFVLLFCFLETGSPVI